MKNSGDPDFTPIVRIGVQRVASEEYVLSDEKLRGCPLVSALGDAGARTLLQRGLAMRFPEKVPVFRAGDASDSLFLVLRGEARLFAQSQADSVELPGAGKGEFFGEEDVLGDTGRRASSAVAAGELDVLELPRAAVLEVMEDCPALRLVLSQVAAQRRRALEEMTDFLSKW